MSLDEFSDLMLPAVEEEIQRVVSQAAGDELGEFYTMMAYHLGWEGEGASLETRGKRIRPLLVLLTTAAAGGDWRCSLPAAAAVELVHNFSLIHDDIEDNSSLRRSRLTVWKIWGIPQAINAGDGLFTLAHLALLRMAETTSLRLTLRAARILQQTCLSLTEGQFLDIAYENRQDLSIEAYWTMVSGKTAALLSACTEIGALAAAVPDEVQAYYRQFGHSLGLAFQTLDDLLGIWGNAELTGKSSESDLVTRKKSLPILHGLSKKGEFYTRWQKRLVKPEEVNELARLLEAEGAKDYTQLVADQLTSQALKALESAHPIGEAGLALETLAHTLLKRKT